MSSAFSVWSLYPERTDSRVVGLSGLREFGVLLREVGGKWGEKCNLSVKPLFLYKFFLGVKLWSQKTIKERKKFLIYHLQITIRI